MRLDVGVPAVVRVLRRLELDLAPQASGCVRSVRRRSQELLLILEDYWERNNDLHDIPIYYNSPMATKCLRRAMLPDRCSHGKAYTAFFNLGGAPSEPLWVSGKQHL